MPLCQDCVPTAGLSVGETCDRCEPNTNMTNNYDYTGKESKHLQYVGRNTAGWEVYYHKGSEEFCVLSPGYAEEREEEIDE